MRHAYLLVAVSCLVAPVARAQTPLVVDLGTLGGRSSEATAINDGGQVVGRSDRRGAPPDYAAFSWTQAGGMVDLGAGLSFARAVNAGGLVVGGRYRFPDPAHPQCFAWSAAGGLGLLGGLGGDCSPFAVNGAGQVVGVSQPAYGQPMRAFSWVAGVTTDLLGRPGEAVAVNGAGRVVGDDRAVAFSWTEAGGATTLGTLGGASSHAAAVDDAGRIVGWAALSSGAIHAFSWTELGGMTDLGTLGGETSEAVALNATGEVVGSSELADGSTHAFAWTEAGGMVDLGTLGGASSHATAVNDAGQVVGYSLASGAPASEHAFSWTPSGGMVDLGTLGGTTSRAVAVNRGGQVAGYASTAAGDRHAVLWTPVWSAPTAPGSDVAACTGTVCATFGEVSAPGQTVFTATAPASMPLGFVLTETATSFEVTTSAGYTGPVRVCIGLAAAAADLAPRLLHGWDPVACAGKPDRGAPGVDYSQPLWEDVTDAGYPDPVSHVLCGTVTCLSPFLVAAPLAISGPGASVAAGVPVSFSASYAAGLTATWDYGDGTPPTSATTHAFARVGTFTVTLVVRRGQQLAGQASLEVTVVDATPPVITSVEASPAVLWPPDGKMRLVTVTTTAVDDVTAVPSCVLTVASSESGTQPLWRVVDGAHVELRAERDGSGQGRVYTVTATCRDDAGNQAQASTPVKVPHDARR